MDLYKKYDLKEVINASGKMTILGVSKVSEEVLAAQKFGGQHFFEMSELTLKTGKAIAQLIGAEDAIVVSSASAGIAQSVAAFIGAGDNYHAYHPFTNRIKKREIILPKGHNVDYGTPVEVMVELGGGEVIEAGYANMCTPEHLAMMVTENTAAILYIKSHHTVQKSMLTVSEAAKVAAEHQLPLIVDAAAEENLLKYLDEGADLVIYSGAKALEGPSSGLVIGNRQFIDWVRLQGKGIGRAMKVGKENILGLTTAIEQYVAEGSESGEAMKTRLAPFLTDLNQVPHIVASCEQDAAGREIYRAKITIADSAPLTAKELVVGLKQGNPAIYTRDYRANNSIIEFDIRAVNKAEMEKIVSALQTLLG